jgi:hypothetical protein
MFDRIDSEYVEWEYCNNGWINNRHNIGEFGFIYRNEISYMKLMGCKSRNDIGWEVLHEVSIKVDTQVWIQLTNQVSCQVDWHVGNSIRNHVNHNVRIQVYGQAVGKLYEVN